MTLMEALVILSVLALVIAIAIPVISNRGRRGEVRQAQQDVDAIRNAVADYKQAYGFLPVREEIRKEENEFELAWHDGDRSRAVIRALLGRGGEVPNSKATQFLFAQNAQPDGTFLDPWGKQYKMKFDINGSGKIEYWGYGPYDENIEDLVVVVSHGPNGTPESPFLERSDEVISAKAPAN